MENKNADFTMISHQKKDWNYGDGITPGGLQGQYKTNRINANK